MLRMSMQRMLKFKLAYFMFFISSGVATLVILSMSMLLGNSIQAVATDKYNLTNDSIPVSVYGASVGIVLVFAVIVVSVSMSTMNKQLEGENKKLNLLGLTRGKVLRFLILDFFIIFLISSLVFFPFSMILANGINDKMVDLGVIESNFKPTFENVIMWPSVGGIALIEMIVISITFPREIKKRSYTRSIFKAIFGIILLGGGLTLWFMDFSNAGAQIGYFIIGFMLISGFISMYSSLILRVVAKGLSLIFRGFWINKIFMMLIAWSKQLGPLLTLFFASGFFYIFSNDMPDFSSHVVGEVVDSDSGIGVAEVINTIILVFAIISIASTIILLNDFMKEEQTNMKLNGRTNIQIIIEFISLVVIVSVISLILVIGASFASSIAYSMNYHESITLSFSPITLVALSFVSIAFVAVVSGVSFLPKMKKMQW